MNMAKLGIVSTAGNSFHLLEKPSKDGACRMTTYTLCEVQARLFRNRNRHSFAFYIPDIIGSPLSFLSPYLSTERSEASTERKTAHEVAVLVPLQLILITKSHAYLCGPSKPLQSLLRKAYGLKHRYSKLFQLVTPSQLLKTAVSLAVRGFGGFRLVQLSLGNRVTPSGSIKTVAVHAVQASQRKTWVRTVTKYYSTLDTVTGDYFGTLEIGGCHE